MPAASMTEAFRGGIDNVGSGKFDIPCLRIHSAKFIAASWRLLEGFGGAGVPPDWSLSHVAEADLNAGDWRAPPEALPLS